MCNEFMYNIAMFHNNPTFGTMAEKWKCGKSTLILLLFIIIAMTYNQVQSFQINGYANHYVDIEITGYRALCSKSIAGRGVTRLISWLGIAGPVDCFNKSVPDCYIRIY